MTHKLSYIKKACLSKKTSKLIYITFYIITINAICLIPPLQSVLALTEAQRNQFAANNILFYDPEGSAANSYCISSNADCGIMGTTRDEKLWSGLRHVGFDPEQTAALMGNILNEGGTPTTQEYAYIYARNDGCKTQEGNDYTIWTYNNEHHASCMSRYYKNYTAGSEVAGIGLGFVQWTSKDRREGYLGIMRNLGLLKYFEGDAYKTYGSLTDDQLLTLITEQTGSDAEYWALWCAAIQFIKTEMDGDYNAFYSKQGVEEIAGWVAASYEVCNGCGVGQSSYNQRIQDAIAIYNRYLAGDFDAIENATPTASSAEDGSNITIIGDSITEGAKSDILALLPNADIHSQTSKSFSSGNNSNPSGMAIAQELKESGELRPQVVFALGTNNISGIGNDNINKLVNDIIGPGHNIYFLTNYDDAEPSKYATNNTQLISAAATYNNVYLIDWKSIVEEAKKNNPSTTYIRDETSSAGYAVHPTAEGNKLFAQAIVDGVTGATSSSYNCENISDPNQAISYLQQFIIDTNELYDRNYTIPQDVQVGVNTHTPGSDESVSANSNVLSDWLDKGLITASDATGGCWGATYCGQCTALSGWFVTMMTDYYYNNGNGKEVVSNLLIKNPDLTASQTPTPFSIFSENGSSAAGHTGVVLGTLGNGAYLTIENNQGYHDLMVKKRENFVAKNAVFVDVSSKIKLNHLGTTYE